MKHAQILYSFVLSYLSPFARKVLTLTLIVSLILPDVVRAGNSGSRAQAEGESGPTTTLMSSHDGLEEARTASARQSLLREDSAGVPTAGLWNSLRRLAGSTLLGRHDSAANPSSFSKEHQVMNGAWDEVNRAHELVTGSALVHDPIDPKGILYARYIGLGDLNPVLTTPLDPYNPDDPTDRRVDEFLKYTYKIRNESWKWEDMASLLVLVEPWDSLPW